MTKMLRDHLFDRYLVGHDRWRQHMREQTHLTVYAADLAIYEFATTITQCAGDSDHPASLHIYDITATDFVLELRNLPTTTSIESLLKEIGVDVEDGQTHVTCRLRLSATDASVLRELARQVRMAHWASRTDKFCERSDLRLLGDAINTLAQDLEEFELAFVEVPCSSASHSA